jgi:hypothetical protein
MLYTHEDLLKLIHDTQAVSIWDHAKGPVFWYAANVPGPFYVNTEMVIGAALSQHMLREITAIVAGTVDAQTRAGQLTKLILDAYKTNPGWQKLIATMGEKAKTDFGANAFTVVSGGERRDWLFSIPFAHTFGIPHLFLFKNKTMYCADHLTGPQSALHVSDLINNAASFFDHWLPILKREKIACAGNLCINVRGENGLKRLQADGHKTSCLMTIDRDFFRHLQTANLINRATFEEIAIFFASAQEWAIKYLIGNPALFDVQGCDSKSFERLRIFITTDPWHLRPAHEAFFASMQKAVEQRIEKSAA